MTVKNAALQLQNLNHRKQLLLSRGPHNLNIARKIDRQIRALENSDEQK